MASDPVERDRERDQIWIVVGCSKVKRAVGPSAVVVDGVLLQHDAQMALPGDEHPVGAFGPGGEDPALREGLALGHWAGILSGSMPSLVNTASKESVNLVSRSRIKKRNWSARCPRSATRSRASCVVQAAVGCEVTPRMWAWRLRASRTKNT